jgi:ATP-dependent exoDNAse (exonuclease V) beta subunit
LFFEYDDTVYLVDFKTDKEIQPNEYKQQILCYKDAIKNLYPQVKKIESYLFYLRYGRAELCSKED